MTRNVVNLDALLLRDDLAAPTVGSGDIPGLKITDLEPGLIYSWLRKPDFQRETANWSPEQVPTSSNHSPRATSSPPSSYGRTGSGSLWSTALTA